MKTKPIFTRENNIPDDLASAIELVYQNVGFNCTQPIPETESADYGAYTFNLNDAIVKYRIAKITPTKTGQFVTLWKRKPQGPIEPFDISDGIDFFIVSTRNENNFGQFIFPLGILNEKAIVAGNNKAGKRAMRVYPPWDKISNKQAEQTQRWQMNYFLEISSNKPIDIVRANLLLQP